jgi:predicted HicB family RNase H-like nuclease
MLEYKGYITKIDFDAEMNCFVGEVINIKDVITFQGNTAIELKNELKKSVDCYLHFCKKKNKNPERPFSGKFMVRIPPEIHREIYSAARNDGISLNKWIAMTLKSSIDNHTRH